MREGGNGRREGRKGRKEGKVRLEGWWKEGRREKERGDERENKERVGERRGEK